jgi:hypothetical protein
MPTKKPRISQSFDDQEVDCLVAIVETAKTGNPYKPADPAAFQRTSAKVMRMSVKVKFQLKALKGE